MQAVRWVAFCLSNSTTRTVVHFLPCARNMTAPYPVVCSLTLFGNSMPPRTVQLDGARVRQPDGVRLEDAFELLRGDRAGVYGLVVELAAQQRMDLSPSSCIIELVTADKSVRFRPARLEGGTGEQAALRVDDALLTTGLVMVNASGETQDVWLCPVGEEGSASGVHSVVPYSLREVSLAAEGDAGAGTGSIGIRYQGNQSQGLASFAVYRDAVTKRPVSVCAL